MWYAFGLSYRKADADTRSRYSLTAAQIQEYYQHIFPKYECEGFILSTCNRLSFFLYGKHPEKIEAHFSAAMKADMNQVGYREINKKALKHLLEVASGIDSQILGDFEIIGQIKKAYQESKKHDCSRGIVEKALNTAIHTSRRVKNETNLSAGTSSVSFAAVHFLKEKLANFDNAKILVIGLGDMGNKVLHNLLSLRDKKHIYLCNRSLEKAENLAETHGLQFFPIEELKLHINNFHAVVSAVQVDKPIVQEELLKDASDLKMMIDLSVPASIQLESNKVELIDVDSVSQFIKGNMQQREAALPAVRTIIQEELEKYIEWERAHEASPTIKTFRTFLQENWQEQNFHPNTIQRALKRLENKLFEEVRKNPRGLSQLELKLKEKE